MGPWVSECSAQLTIGVHTSTTYSLIRKQSLGSQFRKFNKTTEIISIRHSTLVACILATRDERLVNTPRNGYWIEPNRMRYILAVGLAGVKSYSSGDGLSQKLLFGLNYKLYYFGTRFDQIKFLQNGNVNFT